VDLTRGICGLVLVVVLPCWPSESRVNYIPGRVKAALGKGHIVWLDVCRVNDVVGQFVHFLAFGVTIVKLRNLEASRPVVPAGRLRTAARSWIQCL
jgi:hypothetical protein